MKCTVTQVYFDKGLSTCFGQIYCPSSGVSLLCWLPASEVLTSLVGSQHN